MNSLVVQSLGEKGSKNSLFQIHITVLVSSTSCPSVLCIKEDVSSGKADESR